MHGSVGEISAAEKINASYIARILRLTLLAPEIVETILDGRQLAEMTLAGNLTRPAESKIAQLSNSDNTSSLKGDQMRSITSADAKNNFGELIDLARAAPVAVTKYDRPVVVVMAVEEFERLKALGKATKATMRRKKEKR